MQEFLKNTPPRTILLLMASLCLLLLAALVSYVVLPEYRHYRQSTASLRLLESVTAQGDTLESEMTELNARVESLNHRLHGDMVNLPQNQMESFIIGRLQGVSWRNHVELMSVTPGMGDSVQLFEEVLFNVRVSGDYFDLYQWLQDMREELGYVVVKQFNILPATATDQGQRLTATFTIVAYREADNV